MSIHEDGLMCKIKGDIVPIKVSDDHPLIVLGNCLPWHQLYEIILPDLQKTAKGKWWCGRALKVRIHLGVYILQQLLNKKDRQIEAEIMENAAYQLFCGLGCVDNWHCPDRTKIEAFRSRLTPRTQQVLANSIAGVAVHLGFAGVGDMDIDSTVQAAHITYPRDATLMVKLASLAHKVGSFLHQTFLKADFWQVDLKKIKSVARQCFYNKDKPLIDLWSLAYEAASRVKRACRLMDKDLPKLPWHISRALRQLQDYGSRYFQDVIPWVLKGEPTKGKTLSFHLKDIACFNKKGKTTQFGRSHQLGRLQGNFMIVGHSDKVRMEDHVSLPVMLQYHQHLFGEGKLISFAADKGYASKANHKILAEAGVQEIGLQLKIPKTHDPPHDVALKVKLQNRRAGIEPLIGHLKAGWQMGKSRMKTDATCLSSAYTSVLGFNLRQLIRHQALET